MTKGGATGTLHAIVRTACRVGVLLIALSLLEAPVPALAATPAVMATQLARLRGGVASDYLLVYSRPADPTTGRAAAAKYLDRRTGEIVIAAQMPSGQVVTGQMAATAGKVAAVELPALVRKADLDLQTAAYGPSDRSLSVAVWLAADDTAAVRGIVERHPEITWIDGRPASGNLATIRSIRAELWDARRQVFQAAQDELRGRLAALGAHVGYASSSAPLVFVDLPAGGVAGLAAESGVVALGLEGASRPLMASAGPTVAADWTPGGGDQGTGIRVGVVEYHNVRPGGDLGQHVVAAFSTTGTLAYTGSGQFDHPTWVAGAVVSQRPGYRGVAPSAVIVTASTGGYTPSLSTDRAIVAAADWALSPSGGNADLLNVSLGQDTAQGSEEARRYFDAVSAEDGRLVVAAAGNYSTFGHWDVLSPATGYNVLAVGGVDDRGTPGTSDDRIWFVPGSNGSTYRDPSGTAWNSYGDFNKPDVSAPAVSVRTANGLAASGTSVATPITAGVVAQLFAREPVLVTWPEATRAIIMAGALRRTPMPDGSLNADHEGAGTVSALWSNRILSPDDGWGGYRFGSMAAGDQISQAIPVRAGQRVRVALAWGSHTSGPALQKTDELQADLDLQVTLPGGAKVGSYTFDNAYEVVDFIAPSSGTATVRILTDRFEGDSESFGMAWTLADPFTDADASIFSTDIHWAWTNGVTVGCAASMYCPAAPVTRAQMASFLVRTLGLPHSDIDRFVDDTGSQHERDINALAAAGITTGCDADKYCPDQSVTRAQMAAFLTRALHLPQTTTDRFTDDTGNIHESSINALAAAGITSGCGTNLYCPSASVSRGEMAAFLHRAFGG